MVKGSCLCGAVGYEISTPLEEMSNCHCGMCRKAHGAAFATYARTAAAGLRYTRGADRVRDYQSSAPITRSFCDTCGANLTFAYAQMPEVIWVAAGSLDGDPGARPSSHIFVASKASWFEITDTLPQHAEYPPHV